MAYFDGVKAGDKVYCLFNGDGEVVAVFNDGRDFPIHIQFESSRHCITFDGKYRVEGDQIVFWQKPEIIDKGKPKDPLIKGAAYLVWWSPEEKYIAVYLGDDDDGIPMFGEPHYGVIDGSCWSNYELFKQPSAVAELSEGAE